MKNSLRFGAIGVAAALTLAACGQAPGSGESGDQSGKAESHSDIKACMVSDSGGFEDKSFNQSGHEGLLLAKKQLGVSVDQAESQADSDYLPNLENMVQGGCDVIIGIGFMMASAITEVAIKNPDVKFALVDSGFDDTQIGEGETLDNARALLFNTAEASYLAGYAAASMSESGKVGTFLGINLPSTAIFADGFSDGITKYNEEKGTDVKLLGWDKAKQDGMATGNFEDQAKGKQFTEQLFEQGADVVMPVAGPVGLGALAAAKDADKMIVWVDADGVETQPDYASVILTSVMKEIGAAVYDTIESVINDTFDSAPYVGDLQNGGVGIAPWHDFADKVPADLDSEIEALRQGIIDGSIVVESVSTPK